MELQKALINHFKTDSSVWTVAQLMRSPGYYNTKYEEQLLCKRVEDPALNTNDIYTLDQIWDCLDPISQRDMDDIKAHINKYVFGIEIKPEQLILEELPEEFEELLRTSEELYKWFYDPDDRSVCDMKIANILQIKGFPKEQAYSILSQTQKGQERGNTYVVPLVDKIYNNPLDVLDAEHVELLEKVNVDKYYEDLARENKQFRIEQEVKKTIDLQDKYTLHGFEDELTDYYIEQLEKQFSSMSEALPFITPRLSKVVPVYGDQLILIAGESGRGKSTTAANILEPLIRENKRVAYISTEETSEAVILRTTCLLNDWNINLKRTWGKDSERKQQIYGAIRDLMKSGNLKFYDSYTYGKDVKTGAKIKPPEMTTSDGIEMALKDIENVDTPFDIVILDYITKVGSSKKNAGDQEWRVIYNTFAMLEEWAKRCKTPFVVFSQLHDKKSEDSSFVGRLPGAKRIFNLATCVIEMSTDYEERTTQFICHKNRDGGILFKATTRYDRGRYIDNPAASDMMEDVD